MKNFIYEALYKKYESQAADALATLEIYFNNPAGIGEHPGIIEEMDIQMRKLSEAQDLMENIELNFKQYSK
jgi:hypothetical protein